MRSAPNCSRRQRVNAETTEGCESASRRPISNARGEGEVFAAVRHQAAQMVTGVRQRESSAGFGRLPFGDVERERTAIPGAQVVAAAGEVMQADMAGLGHFRIGARWRRRRRRVAFDRRGAIGRGARGGVGGQRAEQADVQALHQRFERSGAGAGEGPVGEDGEAIDRLQQTDLVDGNRKPSSIASRTRRPASAGAAETATCSPRSAWSSNCRTPG